MQENTIDMQSTKTVKINTNVMNKFSVLATNPEHSTFFLFLLLLLLPHTHLANKWTDCSGLQIFLCEQKPNYGIKAKSLQTDLDQNGSCRVKNAISSI